MIAWGKMRPMPAIGSGQPPPPQSEIPLISAASAARKKYVMKPQLIFGLVLLVVGVGLFIFGINASHSLADQVSNTFFGRFTHATTWYILGGLGIAVVGLYLLVTNWFIRRT
jgi:hypothetical protein